MLMALSIAPLHSLCLDDQSEVQKDFSGHVMPLVPLSVSLDAKGIIAFLRSIWQKWCATWISCYVMPLTLVLVSHNAVSMLNVAITFFRSRQTKLDVTWLFWSCDTLATGSGIIWCNWCWCHIMPFGSVSVSHDANSIINGTIVFLR